jgi:hypothetical protein
MLIPKAVRFHSQVHRDRLKRGPCCVPGCRRRQIDLHHERRGTGGGTSLLPDDRALLGICHHHHMDGHNRGWRTCESEWGIDLREIAAQAWAETQRTENAIIR